LAPLRKLDIEAAARISGLDAKAFTAKVESIEVVPLATKPITLDMLINRFRSTGGLPDSRDRLYEEGLTLLCDEPRDLPPGGRGSRLTADQRLAVARRVAAVCAFGAKTGVWIGSNMGDVAPEYTT